MIRVVIWECPVNLGRHTPRDVWHSHHDLSPAVRSPAATPALSTASMRGQVTIRQRQEESKILLKWQLLKTLRGTWFYYVKKKKNAQLTFRIYVIWQKKTHIRALNKNFKTKVQNWELTGFSCPLHSDVHGNLASFPEITHFGMYEWPPLTSHTAFPWVIFGPC